MMISYKVFKFLTDRVINDTGTRTRRASAGHQDGDFKRGFLAGIGATEKTLKDELINYLGGE